MKAMWAGRSAKPLNEAVHDFNKSICVDMRMVKEDIIGSLAHADMLKNCGIISSADAEQIKSALTTIAEEISTGKLAIDENAEDIHMFVEAELTARIGDAGKKLHTARSRNDQVALDIKLYLKGETVKIKAELKNLVETLLSIAEKHKNSVMSGYTHLQKAQPITFGHYLMAYASMFLRDLSRLEDAYRRMNYSPLGACALAGTGYPTDAMETAEALGFDGVVFNSIDAVSDRDHVAEICFDAAMIIQHLSRFAEEIILFSSGEFGYIELDDAYATGSSIMPQKKNPDIAELVRGKTGRVYGNLIAILTVMKGIPLAYNKDMQEDKEPVFDSVDTVLACLPVFNAMLKTMTVKTDVLKKTAEKGYINATDVADYLAKKGLPFRDAYKLTGELVAYAIKNDKSLSELSMAEYKQSSELFEEDVYQEIDIAACVQKRGSVGGPSEKAMDVQINKVKELLAKV